MLRGEDRNAGRVCGTEESGIRGGQSKIQAESKFKICGIVDGDQMQSGEAKNVGPGKGGCFLVDDELKRRDPGENPRCFLWSHSTCTFPVQYKRSQL